MSSNHLLFYPFKLHKLFITKRLYHRSCQQIFDAFLCPPKSQISGRTDILAEWKAILCAAFGEVCRIGTNKLWYHFSAICAPNQSSWYLSTHNHHPKIPEGLSQKFVYNVRFKFGKFSLYTSGDGLNYRILTWWSNVQFLIFCCILDLLFI